MDAWTVCSMYVAVFAIFLPIFYGFLLTLTDQSENALNEAIESEVRMEEYSFQYEEIQNFLKISGEYFHLMGIIFLAQILKITGIYLLKSNQEQACIVINSISLWYIYAFFPRIRMVTPTCKQLVVLTFLFYVIPTLLWFTTYKLKNAQFDVVGSFALLTIALIIWFCFYPVKYKPLTNLQKLKRLKHE